MKRKEFNSGIGKSLVLLFIITLFQVNTSKAQTIKDIDTFIDTAMKHWKIPGLAVAIVKDGKIIHSCGYGFKDLKTKEKVTTKTLFSIASSTKPFTATAAAMLVEEKKMSFDIPLKKYFPDFEMFDSMATEKVTLRDLLIHRTGIPREKFYSLNPPKTRKEVRFNLKYFEPSLDFRTFFQYCNETYTVAGDMVAERAGTTWEDLIRKRILEPLGMTNTIFSIKDLNSNLDYAKPYIIWDKEPEEMDYHNADIYGPAGSMISNVEDLSKWLLFNLNKGKANDTQILSSQRMQQLQSPQIVVPGMSRFRDVSYQNYGIGWFINYYRGKLVVHHGGLLYGFSTQVAFLPDENIGLVILTNINYTPFNDVLERHIYDLLLNLDPIDWQKRYIELEEEEQKQIQNMRNSEDPKAVSKIPILPLDNYCGTYESLGYGSLVIRNEHDSLKVKLQKYDCPLFFKDDDQFEIYHPVEHAGWETVFIKDQTGNISSLTVKIYPNVKPVVFRKIM